MKKTMAEILISVGSYQIEVESINLIYSLYHQHSRTRVLLEESLLLVNRLTQLFQCSVNNLHPAPPDRSKVINEICYFRENLQFLLVFFPTTIVLLHFLTLRGNFTFRNCL